MAMGRLMELRVLECKAVLTKELVEQVMHPLTAGKNSLTIDASASLDSTNYACNHPSYCKTADTAEYLSIRRISATRSTETPRDPQA